MMDENAIFFSVEIGCCSPGFSCSCSCDLEACEVG